MVVELDTHLSALAALRAAGVRRVRLYPNGALQSAELYPLALSLPAEQTRELTPEERAAERDELLYGSAVDR